MKQILAIHRNGKIKVNPNLCTHDHTVTIETGHRWAIAGDVTDNEECYDQCLSCGWVLQDDGTWGPHHSEMKSNVEIPY